MTKWASLDPFDWAEQAITDHECSCCESIPDRDEFRANLTTMFEQYRDAHLPTPPSSGEPFEAWWNGGIGFAVSRLDESDMRAAFKAGQASRAALPSRDKIAHIIRYRKAAGKNSRQIADAILALIGGSDD